MIMSGGWDDNNYGFSLFFQIFYDVHIWILYSELNHTHTHRLLVSNDRAKFSLLLPFPDTHLQLVTLHSWRKDTLTHSASSKIREMLIPVLSVQITLDCNRHELWSCKFESESWAIQLQAGCLRQPLYTLRDLFLFFAKQAHEVIHIHRMAGIVGYNSSNTDSGVRLPWFKPPSLLPPR